MSPQLFEAWPLPPGLDPNWQPPVAFPGEPDAPARASLALGIVGLVLIWAEYLGMGAFAGNGQFPGWYGWLLLGPVAAVSLSIVFGIVALHRRRNGTRSARDQAVAGIIVGAAGLVFLLGLAFFVALAYGFSHSQWNF